MTNNSVISRSFLIYQALDALRTQRRVALVGLPGAGKSTLAHMLAEIHTSSTIFWAHLGASCTPYHHDMIFIDWWHTIHPDTSAHPPAKMTITAIHAHLQTMPCIVIYDDVYDVADVMAIQHAVPAHVPIIITTRNDDIAVALSAPTVVCDTLTTAECIQLLAEQLGAPVATFSGQAWVNDMLTALHYHPFAIQLWSTYLQKTSADQGMWATLSRSLLALPTQDPLDLLVQYPELDQRVNRLFAEHYALLDHTELRILHSFIVIEPDSVITSEFIAQMWDIPRDQVLTGLRHLARAALVQAGIGDSVWSQHPLMRAFTKAQINHETDGEQAVIERFLKTISHYLTQANEQYQFHLHHMHHQYETAFQLACTHHHTYAVLIVDACQSFHEAYAKHATHYHWCVQLVTTIEHSQKIELKIQALRLASGAAVNMAISVGIERHTYLHQAMHWLESAYALCEQHKILEHTPYILGQLGVVYQELATISSDSPVPFITRAIEVYQTLAGLPGLSVANHASTSLEIVNCYLILADVYYPHGQEALQAAVDTCNDALTWLPPGNHTDIWISLYATLSSAYSDFAVHDPLRRAEHLEAAIDASNTAISYVIDRDDPSSLGRYLMNRGNLYTSMAYLLDVDHEHLYHKAIADFEESLSIRTVDTVPMEYSWTQHNMSYLLQHVAHCEGFDRFSILRDALHANDEALRFRTVHEFPYAYALTHYVRALICRDLADIPDQPEPTVVAYITQGIDSITQTRDFSDKQNDISQRAACDDIHSSLLVRLARHQDGAQRHMTLDMALTLSDQALADFHDNPDSLAEVSLNRAHLFALRSQHQADTRPDIMRSNEALTQARAHTSAESQPMLYAQILIEGAQILLQSNLWSDHLAQICHSTWHGYQLACRLHHNTLIKHAIEALRLIRQKHTPSDFHALWRHSIAEPIPDWLV